MNNDSKLHQILNAHDPEFDVPQQKPIVSWVELELLRSILELERKLNDAIHRIMQLENSAKEGWEQDASNAYFQDLKTKNA